MLFLPFCRLWFLWPGAGPLREDQTEIKCGCLGGCLFFSSKSTNRQFLSLKESPNGRATGMTSIHDTENDYGKSILQKGQWVFAVCDRSPVESPSKEFKFTNAFATAPTHIGEVQPAEVEEVASPDETDGPQSQEEPVQVDSSSTPSVHDSQVLAAAQVHAESASTVGASLASEPTITDRRGSSITVGSVPGGVKVSHHVGSPWVGSCHSLPVETMKQWGSAGTMTHSRNMSADAVKYSQGQMYSSEGSSAQTSSQHASLETDFETPDSIPVVAYHADSISSGSIADSEYFSAEDDEFSANETVRAVTIKQSQSATSQQTLGSQSPQSPMSQLSQVTIATGETSSQTIDSPDKPPPPTRPQIKSSSSPSYMSAASSEEAMSQIPDPKHPVVHQDTVSRCNTAPYRSLVTQTACEAWVTPTPVHPPFNAQDSPTAVLNKGNILLPQFGVIRQGL